MDDNKEETNINVESPLASHEEIQAESELKRVKKKKPGIVYLPTFPPYMTIMKAKEIFGRFGEIGRTYFQPKEGKGKGKKNKPSIHFSEGWIEFKSKRIAKEVASVMNNTIVGGKRNSKYYDCLWNVKYLPGFKWIHLNERIAYEKAVRRHKLRIEIAQAKKEANIFAANVDKSKKLKDTSNKQVFENNYIQRQTESEIILSKSEVQDRTEFLKSLFVNTKQ